MGRGFALHTYRRARSRPRFRSAAWWGAFTAALAAPALGLSPGGLPSASAEADDPWVTVDLGPSRVDPLDLAIHHGTIALAHTPPDDADGGLTYLSCRADCHDGASWHRTRLVSGHDVQDVNLTFDPWGTLHLAYRHGRHLVYATCAASCDRAISWSAVALDQMSSYDRDLGGGLSGISLALDAGGRARIAYIDEDSGGPLKFASCDRQCTEAARWSISHLTVAGTANPMRPELAYVGAEPRLVYARSDRSNGLVYATCHEHCLGADQWQHTRLPIRLTSNRSRFGFAFEGPRARLAVPEDNRPTYLECDNACSEPANWSPAVVDSNAPAGHVDLALARSGPRLAYVGDWGGWLRAGECRDRCTRPERWAPTSFPALTGPAVIGADGDRLRIAAVIYPSDRGPGRLKVGLCDAACGDPAAHTSPSRNSAPPSTSTRPPQVDEVDDAAGEAGAAAGRDQGVIVFGGEPAPGTDTAPGAMAPTGQIQRRFELRSRTGHTDASPPNSAPGVILEGNGEAQVIGPLPPPTGQRAQRPSPGVGSLTEVLVSAIGLLAVSLAGLAAFRIRRRAHQITHTVIRHRHSE